MQETLRKLREKRASDRGFTMIELLVVVVIIGVLVAIAIPLYLNYRKGAENKSAQADVRSAISTVEQFYTDNGNTYPADVAATAGSPVGTVTLPAVNGGTTQTIGVSPGNTIGLKNNGATYVICARNSNGAITYAYNSAAGGAVKKSSTQDGTISGCLGTP